MSILKEERITDDIVRLTLNRPEKLNALNRELLVEIKKTVHDLDEAGVPVIVFEGEGRAFTSGADLDEDEERIELFQDITWAVRKFDGIVIGKLHGWVVGGGFEFTLSFDLRYAAPDATFKMTETEIGVVVSNGSTLLLPLTVGPGIAREMIYTGREVGADEAADIGLVSGVYEGEELEEKVREVATDLVENKDRTALRLNKEGLNNAIPIERVLEHEAMLSRLVHSDYE